nr:4316_t:CDS:2 [Entrophospora candida]
MEGLSPTTTTNPENPLQHNQGEVGISNRYPAKVEGDDGIGEVAYVGEGGALEGQQLLLGVDNLTLLLNTLQIVFLQQLPSHMTVSRIWISYFNNASSVADIVGSKAELLFALY